MIEFFKQFFRTPSSAELAMRELAEARRELLKAQSGMEYAHAMCEFHSSRIRRLETLLGVRE